jgi:hypothetical protein
MQRHRISHRAHVSLEQVEEHERFGDLAKIRRAHQAHDRSMAVPARAMSDPSVLINRRERYRSGEGRRLGHTATRIYMSEESERRDAAALWISSQ